MKTLRILAVAAVAVCSLNLSSCVSPYAGPNESIGGVLGAATGALAGGIIGNQRHRGLEGAAIGGVIGAVAGSVVGNANDNYYGYPRYSRTYSPSYYDYPPPVVYTRPYSGPSYGYGYNPGYGCRPNYYRPRCW